MSAAEPLERVRGDGFAHWLALVVATVAGLALASVHWLGLVAGGALVGLVATTLKRAVLAGLGFGVFAVVAWLGLAVAGGAFAAVTATGQFVALTAAIGVVMPVLGSLVRGVV